MKSPVGGLLACASSVLFACGGNETPPSEPGAPEPRVVPLFDDIHISSLEDAKHFQHAQVAVDFGSDPLARATLSVTLKSPCFPFDGWTAETIPDGHNFPRLCDGFDRTLLLSLDDPSDPDTDPPGIELVRAITPFGGPLHFDVDITDVANARPGVHDVHVDIQTWPDPAGVVSGAEGEWLVKGRIVLEPGTPPRSVLAVVPLVFGSQTQAELGPLPFTVPADTTSARLEYRTTGHGGAMVPDDPNCIGPAEEFCERLHTISLDGALVAEVSPWRSDCATLCTLSSYESASISVAQYCAENPTGLPASVRAPRANWCPGSLTAPYVFENEELAAPGEHELSIALDALAEGGSWLQSLVFYAYE